MPSHRVVLVPILAALVAAASLVPAATATGPSAAPPGVGLAAARAFETVGPRGSASGTSAGSRVDAVGVWPLAPRPEVVSGFDPPELEYGAGHRGVDLLGSPDQPVRSALAGRVTYAAPLAGRGVVVVEHGDTRTTYQPVAATVSVGDRVAAGDRIGTLQPGGSHCPPRSCLHWGWIRGKTYLDPLLLVGAGPVRLLPLWRDRPVGGVGAPMTPANPYSGAGWSRRGVPGRR